MFNLFQSYKIRQLLAHVQQPQHRMIWQDANRQFSRNLGLREILLIGIVSAIGGGIGILVFWIFLSPATNKVGLLGLYVGSFVLCGIFSGFFAARITSRRILPYVRQELLKLGYCPDCGYDQRGNDSEKCPECGRKGGQIIP
jgi:hypothetical protein